MYLMKHLWWFAFIGVAEHLEETMVRQGRFGWWQADWNHMDQHSFNRSLCR